MTGNLNQDTYNHQGVKRKMDQEKKAKREFSRRQFLKGVPLGIAGVVAINAVSGGFISSIFGRRRRLPDFPKDSIFAPDKDRYKDIA